MFNDCKEAEKYNNIEEDDEEEIANEANVEEGDGNEVEDSEQMEKNQTQEKLTEEVTTEQNTENDALKRKSKLINWHWSVEMAEENRFMTNWRWDENRNYIIYLSIYLFIYFKKHYNRVKIYPIPA